MYDSAPFGGLSGPNAAETDEFLVHLAELPISRWPTSRASTALRATALALLDAVLADQQLGVTTWLVRDLVQTSSFLATCGARDGSAKHARHDHDARENAESAALALLVRPLLPTEEFAALYAPFAQLVPLRRPILALLPPEPARAARGRPA